MLDGDLLNYMQTASGLIAEIDPTQIYLGGVISQTAKMPYIGIDIFPGVREKTAKHKVMQHNRIKITVNVGPDQKKKGRVIADKALRVLDFLRGSMYDVTDLDVVCGSVGLSYGVGGIHRYSFTATMRFVESI